MLYISSYSLARGKSDLPLWVLCVFLHKSQGQTYDKVVLNLNSHIFAPGQLYVALSRVKSLGGLYLTRPISYSDIIEDESIYKFLNKMRRLRHPIQPLDASDSKPAKSTMAIFGNSICQNFAIFIRNNETDETMQESMLYCLKDFQELIAQKENGYACLELRKITDMISSSYESFPTELDDIDWESTKQEPILALNKIYELYTEVVKTPKKQIVMDHKIKLTNKLTV